MPPPFADEGIVLRRVDYGDADRILTVFTRDHGKVGVLVRGARRPRSRLGPAVDLFSRCALQLAPGRGLHIVTQVERRSQPWPGSDLIRTTCAAVVAGAVDALLEERHPDPELYAQVAVTLDRLGGSTEDARAELAWFARATADRLGYRPEIDHCVGCGDALVDLDAVFSPARGGVLQGRCAALEPAALPCHAATLRVLRCMARGDRATFDRLRWEARLRDELEEIVLSHLAHHLDRPLRAADLLRRLRPGPGRGQDAEAPTSEG